MERSKDRKEIMVKKETRPYVIYKDGKKVVGQNHIDTILWTAKLGLLEIRNEHEVYSTELGYIFDKQATPLFFQIVEEFISRKVKGEN